MQPENQVDEDLDCLQTTDDSIDILEVIVDAEPVSALVDCIIEEIAETVGRDILETW